MKNIKLSEEDVKNVLMKEVLVGTDISKDKKHKKITFSPWSGEFIIYIGDKQYETCPYIIEAIKDYNKL